jgi:hypothetical protein
MKLNIAGNLLLRSKKATKGLRAATKAKEVEKRAATKSLAPALSFCMTSTSLTKLSPAPVVAGRSRKKVAAPKPKLRGLRKPAAPAQAKQLWASAKITGMTGARLSLETERLRQKYERMQEDALQEIEQRGIVTHKEEHEDHADIRLQGDTEMHTADSLMEREKLKSHPALKDVVMSFWEIFDDDDSGSMSHGEYIALNKLLHKALLPDVSEEEAEASAQTDWAEDSKGEEHMPFEAFFESMFQLADIWCEEICSEEYEAFLANLLNLVAEGHKLRQMAEVDCVVALGLEHIVEQKEKVKEDFSALMASTTSTKPTSAVSTKFSSHRGWGKSSQWNKLKFALMSTSGSSKSDGNGTTASQAAQINKKIAQAKKRKLKSQPVAKVEDDEFAPAVLVGPTLEDIDLDALRPLQRFVDVEHSLSRGSERYYELKALAAVAAKRCYVNQRGVPSSIERGAPSPPPSSIHTAIDTFSQRNKASPYSSSSSLSVDASRGHRAVQLSMRIRYELHGAEALLREAQHRHDVCLCSNVGALKVLQHRSFQNAVDDLNERLRWVEEEMDSLRSFTDGVGE